MPSTLNCFIEDSSFDSHLLYPTMVLFSSLSYSTGPYLSMGKTTFLLEICHD